MIENLTAIEHTRPQQSEKISGAENVAIGFSFASAVAALEERASQSLQTFGAQPQGTATAVAPQKENQPAERTQAQATGAKGVGQAGKTLPPADAKTSSSDAAPQRQLAPPPQSPSPAQPAPLTLVSQSFAPAQVQQAFPTAARVETARPSSIETQRPAIPKAPRIKAPAAAQQPSQDFAKLLARRLNAGVTAFELRLDPPEMGRVDAHLKVGDDGDALLTLKFENQIALDHFAHDEAALRSALTSSGFNLDGDRVIFTLAEDEPAAALSPEEPAFTTHSYEPLFLAPFSEGAVDIRI